MLRVERLEVYGLQPVSLEVESGECIAVNGPSGSGKTLLLRAIADLDPVAGSVFLRQRERATMPAPEWRSHVRYAAAEPGWWEDTPRAHFSAVDGLDDKAAALGLGVGKLDQPLAELSTGERQRLALLRALENGPDILLLDEPTGSLDAGSTRQVEKLLKSLLKAGASIILVSHDPKQAARLACRQFAIRNGRLVRDRR